MQTINQQAGGIASTPRDYGSVPLSGGPPAQTGIASALQELNAQICSTSKLAHTCRAALGISQPSEEGKIGNPSSMLDMLCDMRIRLSRANDDIDAVINHINS
jgi:hypothetical protein